MIRSSKVNVPNVGINRNDVLKVTITISIITLFIKKKVEIIKIFLFFK